MSSGMALGTLRGRSCRKAAAWTCGSSLAAQRSTSSVAAGPERPGGHWVMRIVDETGQETHPRRPTALAQFGQHAIALRIVEIVQNLAQARVVALRKREIGLDQFQTIRRLVLPHGLFQRRHRVAATG